MALVCFGAALSQAPPASAQSPVPAGAKQDEARRQVLDTTEQWIAAENKHNAAALRQIIDDKFISTYAANKPRDKDAFIKGITDGPVDPTQSQSLTDQSIVIDGDTAVIVGTDTFHSATKPPVPPLRYTITYVKRQGHWRALGEHIVTIPGKP